MNGSVTLSASVEEKIEVSGNFSADCDMEANQIKLRGNMQFHNLFAEQIDLAGKVNGDHLKGKNVVVQISNPSILTAIEADDVIIRLEHEETCQDYNSLQLTLKKISCKTADIENVHCDTIQADKLIVRGKSIIGTVDCLSIQKDEISIIKKQIH